MRRRAKVNHASDAASDESPRRSKRQRKDQDLPQSDVEPDLKKATLVTKKGANTPNARKSSGLEHHRSKDESNTIPAVTAAETTSKAPVATSDPPSKQASSRKGGSRAKGQSTVMLAARTKDTALRIGAHVSAAGGCDKAVSNALKIGANAFALFLKSQRKWDNPPLKDEVKLAFVESCKTHDYNSHAHCVPHGSYLVNLAAEAKDKAEQAYKSFIDDLERCDKLGVGLYNFHPGNTNGAPRAQALTRISKQLNRAHKSTSEVVVLLENMAASPEANTIGGRFEDLRDIIAQTDDKSRVGVCLDTCHAFAAGYDMRDADSLKATMEEFDRVIGIKYLRAVHLNDSKGMFQSHRDLHQNIGLGFLGLRAFHAIVNDGRFHGIPLILETPCDKKDDKGKSVEDESIWADEIKLLESLVGMDPAGPEFTQLERDLARKGEGERERLQKQFESKKAKPQRKRKAQDSVSDDGSQ